MLRCTSGSSLDSIKLVSKHLSERVRLDCTNSGECFEDILSEDIPKSTDTEHVKTLPKNDTVSVGNWSCSLKFLNKSLSADSNLKENSIGNLKAMTDMTMNSNLMFRSMFFMNDEATRHFLAPPLPPIQACDIQPDYLQKKLPQGPISPGTSPVTTSSTNTGQITSTANSSDSPQQHHQPLEKPLLVVPKQRPHNCEECGKTFLMKHHLSTHMRVHTGERPHVCPECGKSFALKHCLSTHLLLHTADRPYKCTECNKSFTLKHHLVSHERVHTRERPFECPECGQRFPQKRHLSTHIKFHSGERPFSCQVCGESFSREEHLVMHSRFHGGLSPYNCPDCGAGFLRKFELVNHERQHGRNPESCPTCGKEFLQKRTLLVHVRSCGVTTPVSMSCQQSPSPPRFPEGTPPRVSDSSSPGYFFGTPSRFHNDSDSQRFPENTNNQFRFTDGQIRFSDGSSSSASPMSMQIAKDKVCKECGETFASVEGLALHLRLHFGDHSFLADICSLAASLKQTAVNVAASLKKTHICTDCGRGFTQRHGLFQHRQRHANGSCKEKPFACEKCVKSFAQKNHLTLHERQHMDHTRNSPVSKKGPCSNSEDSCMEDQQIEPTTGDNIQSNAQCSNRAILLHQNHTDIQRVDLLNRHSQDTSTNENNQRTSQSENRKEMECVMASSMMLQQSHPDHHRVDIMRHGQDSSPTGESTQRTSQSENRKDLEQVMANSILLQQKQIESTTEDNIQRNSQCGNRTILLHQNHPDVQREDILNRHSQDASKNEHSQRTSQSENQKEMEQVMANSMMLQQSHPDRQRIDIIIRHGHNLSPAGDSTQRTTQSEKRKELGQAIMLQQNHSDSQSAEHMGTQSAESHRSLNTPVPIALIRMHNNRMSHGNIQHDQSSGSCLHPVHNKQY